MFYNIILNIDSSGTAPTIRKLYLSRAENLREYFEKEGSLDIFHLDNEQSPHFNGNLKLDRYDGIYLSWRPHIVDMYLLEKSQEEARVAKEKDDGKEDDEKAAA